MFEAQSIYDILSTVLLARRERRHTHHHLQPLTSSRSRDLQVRFVSTSSSSVVSVASSSLSSEVVDTGEIALEDMKTRFQ